MIDILLTPGVFFGFLLGLVAAFVFNWLAPAGAEVAAAGAWLIGLGCLAGVVWSIVFNKPQGEPNE